MNAIGDRMVAMIEDYSASFRDLSDDKAMKLVDDYLTVEADRVKVRRTYVAEFAKVLPGRKVARFYQIENKMDAVIRYDLAATIPVVEERAARPRSDQHSSIAGMPDPAPTQVRAFVAADYRRAREARRFWLHNGWHEASWKTLQKRVTAS